MSKTSNLSNRGFAAKRLATDGILIAIFFALTFFSVTIGGVKITFDSLPVVLCAMLFGPIDAFLVGFLGAFLEQMMHFGFTATTLLWVIPPAMRGLVLGLAVKAFKKSMDLETILHQKKPYLYFVCCCVAGVVTSCLNTLVYYIDSTLYGYYSYALIFGVFGVRILSGIAASILTAIVALPILVALRKAKIVPATKKLSLSDRDA